jgi:hypothetical protein
MKSFRIVGMRLRKNRKKGRKRFSDGEKKCNSEGRKSVTSFKKTVLNAKM